MAAKKKTIEEKIDGLTKTVDNLAAATARGFEEAQKTSDERFKVTVDEFDRIRSDIRDIKTTLGPLVRVVALQEKESMDLRFRIGRVERKVGIKNDQL